VRYLVIAGCVVDFWFGILLHARVQSLENTPAQVVFADTFTGADPSPKQLAVTGAVSQNTWANWATKHRYEIVDRTLLTAPQRYHDDPAFQQAWPAMKANLESQQNDDAKNWGGWKSRHRGVLSYLGDWVAGDSGHGTLAASVIFCLFFAGLIAAFVRAGIGAPVASRSARPGAPADPQHVHMKTTTKTRRRHVSARH
jgi:hypothetical protein